MMDSMFSQQDESDRECDLVEDYWDIVGDGTSTKPGAAVLLEIARKTLTDESAIVTFVMQSMAAKMSPSQIRNAIHKGDHRRKSSGCIAAVKVTKK